VSDEAERWRKLGFPDEAAFQTFARTIARAVVGLEPPPGVAFSVMVDLEPFGPNVEVLATVRDGNERLSALYSVAVEQLRGAE